MKRGPILNFELLMVCFANRCLSIGTELTRKSLFPPPTPSQGSPPHNFSILEAKHHKGMKKVATLAVVSFGRAVGELSRKGRRLGHGMLTGS